MVFLSIIIPCFNSSQTLPRLWESIKKENIRNYEIIIVDDASSDETEKLFLKAGKIQFYKLNKNHGPAYARNFGAKKATGEVLLFLDSDVVVLPGTLKEVIKIFKEDKYRVAATGVWDKKQESQKFFPKFKALRDWSYWINERKADSYYYLFSTRIAAIRRDVFLAMGGFNENFRGADVEDIEFTYRLAKKYRIDFNQNLRVHHEFEGFLPIAQKYFKRAYQWVEIFQNRKKFDPVATTGNEAITTISAVGFLGSLGVLGVLGVLGGLGKLGELGIEIAKLLSAFCFLLFVIHLFGVRKFLKFVYQEEGFVFALKSFFMGIILYHFIFAGALLGWWRKR